MRHLARNHALLLFVYLPCLLNAQKPSVRNVTFEQNEDDIIVRYTLAGDHGEKYTVMLSVSDDYGKTFLIHPDAVEGEIGKDIRTGTNKQIIWRLRRDYPDGLEGDGYVFAVDAVLQKGSKKWPYFVGAAVAGGAVYYLTSGKKAEEQTTGSIAVQVPADF